MLFSSTQFSGGKHNSHNSILQKKPRQRDFDGQVLGYFTNQNFHEVMELQIRHAGGIASKWELFLSGNFTRRREDIMS